MSWFCFVAAFSLWMTATVVGKPFSIGDFRSFEDNVGKLSDNGNAKRTFHVIKPEVFDPSQGKHKRHHNKANPYAPEPKIRKHGKSVTEAIEELNSQDKNRTFTEGDIVDPNRDGKRVAVSDAQKKWPGGVVPFTYQNNFTYENQCQAAMDILMKKTCLRFRPKTGADQDYVRIIKERGCWSLVGKDGGQQDVSIGEGCEYTDTIIHELLHAIGFWHEQNRPDRDSYLRIRHENIDPDQLHNFQKRTTAESVTFKPYDYKSLMQYGNTDFSKNGENTMEAINDPDMELGQPIGSGSLTNSDIYEINQLYSCNEKPVDGTWSAWSALSACSLTCGRGVAVKTRECNTPAPMHGGKQCEGDSKQDMPCNSGECPSKTDLLSCSFESSDCGFHMPFGSSEPDYQLKWSRIRGSTPSPETGPDADHTIGTQYGHYVYMEAGTAGGDGKGLYNSPVLSSDGKRPLCLSYHVHMKGEEGMGQLNVFDYDLVTQQYTLLRTHSGDLGDVWYHNRITLPARMSHQISFEGNKMGSWKSDIALDDISVKDGPCANGPHDCDFEGSTCAWRAESTVDYPLDIYHGNGPDYDWSGPAKAFSGSGYMIAFGYYASIDDEATLKSSLIEASSSGSVCLSFWYQMDIDGVGSLLVKKIEEKSRTMSIMFYKSGSPGMKWTRAEVTIPATKPMELEFLFLRGDSEYGDTAIDKVSIRDGTC